MKIKIDKILCFSCGEIFENNNSSVFVCPFCDFEIKRPLYFKIYKNSHDSIYFGYIYRNAYENAYKKHNEIKVRFKLDEPSEALIFIGISILSGIIGNRSDALVMRVINKIKSYYIKFGKQIPKQAETIDEIKKLQLFIREFENKFGNLPDNVRTAIFEEMIGDEMDKNLKTDSQYGNMLNDRKKFRKELFAARKRLQKRQALNNVDMKDFWSNID
uniref:Uncharacterized protein n=1 Tax=Desulfovibrio sp. U5L TaxID=596152 RepID=I2Q475_9BACT